MRCSNKISSNRKIFRPEKERQDYGRLLPPRWPRRHRRYRAPPPAPHHQEARRPEQPALATPLHSQAPSTDFRAIPIVTVTGGGGGTVDSQGTGARDGRHPDRGRSTAAPYVSCPLGHARGLRSSTGSEPKPSPPVTQQHTARSCGCSSHCY